MTFANLTPLSALDVPVTDPTDRALVLVVVKGTFDLQGNRLERQAPVLVADVPTDPDATADTPSAHYDGASPVLPRDLRRLPVRQLGGVRRPLDPPKRYGVSGEQ